MRLAESSRLLLEGFFREHFADPGLELPEINLYHGRLAGFVTRRLRIGAITFGHRVLIKPKLVTSNDGKLVAPGWLVAHEATHVLQYARQGYVRFFYLYLKDYWRALRRSKRWDAAARQAAYLAITHERQAQEVEHAYQVWSAHSAAATAEK